MKNRRGWSLIGVLAALMILSTVVALLLRFNYQIEKQMRTTATNHNELRLVSWGILKGNPLNNDTIIVERVSIKGIQISIVQQDNVKFYVIPVASSKDNAYSKEK